MPKGVEIRGQSIRVTFHYEGERCRETLQDLKPTPENIRYAENLIAAIDHQISSGTFDYISHFPNSQRLDSLRLQRYINIWLRAKELSVAPSTYKTYRMWANGRISPRWGNRIVEGIKHSEIQNWVNDELSGLSNKTIKELLSILVAVLNLYARDNHLAFNPATGIQLTLPDDLVIDPFTREEIDRISSTSSELASEHNMAVFHLWTGLRMSELLALSWHDVDLTNNQLLVRRARVYFQYKVTKTRGSTRTLNLLAPAVAALQKQQAISQTLPETTIEVLQRDNKTVRKEKFAPVFTRSSTGKAFSRARHYRQQFWQQHLENAKVRHRGPNNCRHTFASQMLTAGMPLSWILSQTGHTSEQTLRKRYAKFINQDSPTDMAAMANSTLNLNI